MISDMGMEIPILDRDSPDPAHVWLLIQFVIQDFGSLISMLFSDV